MPERVREQVEEDSLDLVGRDADDGIGGDACAKLDVARPRLGLERAHAARDQLTHRRVAQLQSERAGVDPRQLEKVFDELREDLCLDADRLEILAGSASSSSTASTIARSDASGVR